MADFSLTRRREIRVPTLFGWLVLLVSLALTGMLAGRHVHAFLMLNDPAPRARLLVVEGWLAEKQLDQAIAAYRRGNYEQVITTGGPVEPRPGCVKSTSYAELARDYLKAHGIEDAEAVPAPASAQDRTFLSAVMAREWMRVSGRRYRSFDLYSGGVHGRRTRLVYGLAFGADVAIGVLSAAPEDYEESRWWLTSAGAKTVLGESISLLWTACCFHPPAPGSHEEKWGPPRPGKG